MLGYQDILAAAYRQLGQINADADYAEQQAKTNLDQQMSDSGKNRAKSVLGNRENASSRGLLDSSIALQGEGDVNSSFDHLNDVYSDNYKGILHQTAVKRVNAQQAYDDAKTNAEQASALSSLSVDTPGILPPETPQAVRLETPSAPTGYMGYSADEWQNFINNTQTKQVANTVKAIAPKKPVAIRPKIITPVQSKKAVFF